MTERPLGFYEGLLLDFWEQAEPSQIPKILLCNNYGGEEAPWFTLRAKLPFKEMEGRWRGRIPPDMPKHQVESLVRKYRSIWHSVPADVLDFAEIVRALVSLTKPDCPPAPTLTTPETCKCLEQHSSRKMSRTTVCSLAAVLVSAMQGLAPVLLPS